MFELHSLKREQVAQYTGIPVRSLNRIRKNYADRGAAWGENYANDHRASIYGLSVDENHKDIIRECLQSKPVSYLDELRKELFFQSGLVISVSTLSRALLSMGYTRKRLSRLFYSANANERFDFREKARGWVDGHTLFFLDALKTECQILHASLARITRYF